MRCWCCKGVSGFLSFRRCSTVLVSLTGTFFVDSLSGFALLLLIFRLVGIAATFCWLPMQSVSPTRFWAHLRPSLGFLSADLVNYGSDQILIVAISYMLSRDELGVIGLCRQIVGVADAPGWAMVQAAYPAIVADPISEVPRFYSRLVWLAGWTAIGFIALRTAWVMGLPYSCLSSLLGHPACYTSSPLPAHVIRNWTEGRWEHQKHQQARLCTRSLLGGHRRSGGMGVARCAGRLCRACVCLILGDGPCTWPSPSRHTTCPPLSRLC